MNPDKSTGAPFKKFWKRRLEELVRLDGLNAPDVILARTLANLLRTAHGYLGKHLSEELGRVAQEAARRSYGICQWCDFDALPNDDLCDACRKENDLWAAQMEAENPEPDDEEA